MEGRRWAWENIGDVRAIGDVGAKNFPPLYLPALWEAAHKADGKRVHGPGDWVVDCMMGCYNFTEPEED